MPTLYAKRAFSPYGKAVAIGAAFEVQSEQEANVLVHIGYASRTSAADEPSLHDWAELVGIPPLVPEPRKKRAYRRRDLQAEE